MTTVSLTGLSEQDYAAGPLGARKDETEGTKSTLIPWNLRLSSVLRWNCGSVQSVGDIFIVHGHTVQSSVLWWPKVGPCDASSLQGPFPPPPVALNTLNFRLYPRAR